MSAGRQVNPGKGVGGEWRNKGEFGIIKLTLSVVTKSGGYTGESLSPVEHSREFLVLHKKQTGADPPDEEEV